MPTSFPVYANGDVLTLTDMNDIVDAIKNLEVGASFFKLATGSTNTFLIDLDPDIDTYTNGLMVIFQANNSVSGATQINVNSKGLKDLIKNDGSSLVTGDILDDGIYIAIYDGTDFRLMNPENPTLPRFVDDETPGGTIDGVNDTFELDHIPSPVASLQVFVNGVYMRRAVDYTITGDDIIFGTPPAVSAEISAFYRY